MSERLDKSILVAILATVLLAVVWTVPFSPDHAWGWDEAMHVGLPGARIAEHLREGSFTSALGVILADCQRYPFVAPLGQAALHLLGIGEVGSRLAMRVLYAVTCLGLFLTTREAAARLGESLARQRIAAFVALGFGLLCPLGLAYAGTLFLEVPCLFLAVFTVRARLRCSDPEALNPLARDLAFGCWLVALFFAKWNYGLLFLGAFLLEALVGRIGAERRPFGRVLRSFLPLAAMLLWWFALPLPGGLELAESHRVQFADYLQGNLQLSSVPASYRAVYLSSAFTPTLRLLLVLLLGLILAVIGYAKRPAVRTLLLIALVVGVPILTHRFFQERFVLPVGAALWPLAGLGLARLSRADGARGWLPFVLILLALPFASRDARFVAKRVGLWNEDKADYQTWLFSEFRDLHPDRSTPSAGLRRETYDQAIEWIAAEMREGERFGWIGISTELSPGALHLGLLERGSPRAPFLRDAHRQLFLDFGEVDPECSDERLRAFAEEFDVLFATSPSDLKSRSVRAWTARYRDRIVALGWQQRSLGVLAIDRPLADPIQVELFSLRAPTETPLPK